MVSKFQNKETSKRVVRPLSCTISLLKLFMYTPGQFCKGRSNQCKYLRRHRLHVTNMCDAEIPISTSEPNWKKIRSGTLSRLRARSPMPGRGARRCCVCGETSNTSQRDCSCPSPEPLCTHTVGLGGFGFCQKITIRETSN